MKAFWHAADASHPVIRDGHLALTSRQLQEQVSHLAETLAAAHIRCLGLHADNGLSWVIADLACLEAGIICVPLPLFFTSAQLEHVLASCGVNGVLTPTPALFNTFTAHAGSVPGELTLLVDPAAPAVSLPSGTGKITFTSGSTGQPKGVCLSAAQQLCQAHALAEAVGLTRPRHLCVLPLATLLENIAGLYAPLVAGGEVVLNPLAELGFEGSRLVSPQRLIEAITQLAPKTLVLIPQLLLVLVQAARSGWQPPAMDFIAVGGSRVSPALIHEARALGLPVYEGYGLSECASVVSLNTPRQDAVGTVGRVLPNLHVSLADDEVIVEGNAMLGYVGEPESWYPRAIRTGDLGHLDGAGYLHISGRRKNLLISSYGRNIAPEWVESELLATPVLAEAVVFGDAQPCCVALVSTRDPATSDDTVRVTIEAANARLPDYARVLCWHRLSAPLATTQPTLLTANGRPRRAEIAKVYAAQLATLHADALLIAGAHVPS